MDMRLLLALFLILSATTVLVSGCSCRSRQWSNWSSWSEECMECPYGPMMNYQCHGSLEYEYYQESERTRPGVLCAPLRRTSQTRIKCCNPQPENPAYHNCSRWA